MAKKKQQSIDSHLKCAGGGTVSKNDVIELSGTEDDTAMEVSDTSAVQPRAKTPATRRAGARKTVKEEEDERNRKEEEDLERALEESRREKEREDRRNRRREQQESVDSSKGSRETPSPVTSPGEVPVRSAPHPVVILSHVSQLEHSSSKLPVPRPPLLQQPGVVPRPPLLQQPVVVARPPLLQEPVVALERVTVPSNCSPVRPHPSPRTVSGCNQSDASKGEVHSCGKSSPMSEGQTEGGVSIVDNREGTVSTRGQSRESNSKIRDTKQKVLSLRRHDRGKKEVGSAGIAESSESDRDVGGNQASPSNRGVRKEEEGRGEAGDSGCKPRTQTPAGGGNSEHSYTVVSKPGGRSSAQTQIDTATPPPVQAVESKPRPPQLWAPPGASKCQYTSVILRVFDDYIEQLETAQSRQLVRVPWGPPITPKTGVSCVTSRSRVNTKEVWSLPYREESDTSDASDEGMESEPPQPTKKPTKPVKLLVGSKADQVASKDEHPLSDVFNFCDSSDDELNIQTPTPSSKPNYTIATITPTKGSTITSTAGANNSSTVSCPLADAKQQCSPADKDVTPPLSGGGPFESKGKVSPPVARLSSPTHTRGTRATPSNRGMAATPSNRGVAATPSNSTWLSKRDAATTPAGRSATGSREKFSLGRKRKPEQAQCSSSFDQLVDEIAKRPKTSQLPSKSVPIAPHRALWVSRGKEEEEAEEEESGSMERESSEEAIPARNGKGVIDLTEDSSQAPTARSKAMCVCPLCQKQFAQAEVEDHASTCHVDDTGEASPPTPKVRTSLLGPPSEARNVLECSNKEKELVQVLSGSPDEEEEAEPSPKMATSPQLYPSSEGGFVVDMNTVSDSPIKTFRMICEQADSELYYKPFTSSGARDSTRGTGQRSQPHKRGARWKGRGGTYRGVRKSSRGKGKRGTKFNLT